MTARSLHDEGMRLYHDSKFEEAAAKFAEAQAAFAAANEAQGAAEAVNNRGVCWRQAARWEEACAAFEEARALFKSLEDVAGEGQVVGNLGSLADAQGDPKQAAEYYVEAIELLRSAGEQDLAQATYTALSRLKLKHGDWFGAIASFEAGLDQVEHPNVAQRMARKVLGAPRKLLGGS